MFSSLILIGTEAQKLGKHAAICDHYILC